MPGDILNMRKTLLLCVFMLVLALAIALLWLLPWINCKHCGPTFWTAHLEAQSLATSGKWSGQIYSTDAFSGEFPIYYNTASAVLMNAAARTLNMPSVEFQAAIWGPMLGGFMLLGNFLAILVLTKDRFVSAFAAIVISLCADAAFVDPLYAATGMPANKIKAYLHVPVTSLQVGTDQALAWVLFLPSLVLFYAAVTRRAPLLFAVSGGLFAVLLETHSLTLLNAATAACVFILISHTLSEAGRAGNIRRLGAAAIAIAFVQILLRGLFENFGLANFASIWALCWMFSIRDRTDIVNTLWFATGAALIGSRYLWHLYSLRDVIAQVEVAANIGFGPHLIAIFFLPMWLGTILHLVNRGNAPNRPTLDAELLLAALLGVTFLLSQGFIFGFTNHPYRFAINLIFPLAILSALAIKSGTANQKKLGGPYRWISFVVAAWIALSTFKSALAMSGVAPNAAYVLGSSRILNKFVDPDVDDKAILKELRLFSAAPFDKVLLAPEYRYPQGSARSGVMLSFSNIPAFLPDDRYAAWRDLIRKRVNVFCSLFPDFPHRNAARENYCVFDAAHVASTDGAPHVKLLDLSAAADIVAVYGIKLAADLSGEFAPILQKRAKLYNWKVIKNTSASAIFGVASPAIDAGRIAFERASFSAPIWTVPFDVVTTGRYTFVAAGANAAADVKTIEIDGRQLTVDRRGSDILIFEADLPAGRQELRFNLAPDDRLSFVVPSPLHFLTGVPTDRAATVIAPVASGDNP